MNTALRSERISLFETFIQPRFIRGSLALFRANSAIDLSVN